MKVTKRQSQIGLIHLYRQVTGETEIDMHKVAAFARDRGWPMPKPVDPLDRLAAEFSQAAREEIRRDTKTGRPYRANHAVPIGSNGERQQYLWIDIDEAPRAPMQKSLTNRRDQIVGDVVQLAFDAEHWNRVNPSELPIVVVADFTDDVEERKHTDERSA